MRELLRFWTAGVGVDVDGVDDWLANELRIAGSGMLPTAESRPSGEPQCLLTIDSSKEGVSRFGGRDLDRDPQVAAATILTAVDRAALAATRCLTIHAAALEGAAGAAVVPGPSGMGKSTLAGAAMQSGLRLLSDEAACLDPDDLGVRPHARPLGLSPTSRALLGVDGPPTESAQEWAVAPGLLGRCAPPSGSSPVALVVLAERVGGPAHWAPASRADGATALLASCLNTGPAAAWSPEEAWVLVTRLMPGVTVARLRYDSPHDAAQLLLRRLSGSAETPAPLEREVATSPG
ncbi:MAG: hypothetical protein M3Z83_08480 [Actinomycetota bacterium]|nr:hypothetical protein [Actinomycetota bacterium]